MWDNSWINQVLAKSGARFGKISTGNVEVNDPLKGMPTISDTPAWIKGAIQGLAQNNSTNNTNSNGISAISGTGYKKGAGIDVNQLEIKLDGKADALPTNKLRDKKFIMIHRTAGNDLTKEQILNDKYMHKYNAHYYINRNGKVISMGDPRAVRYQAKGHSIIGGKAINNNKYGIGIEIVGMPKNGKYEDMTPAQKRSLGILYKKISKATGVTKLAYHNKNFEEGRKGYEYLKKLYNL